MRKFLLIAILATLSSAALAAPIFKYKIYAPGMTAGAGAQQTVDPENCVLPWGGVLAHATSVPAYSASTVQSPSSCSSVAITLSCTDGSLSNASAVEACHVYDPYAGNVVLELDFNNGFTNPQNKPVLNSSGVTVANGVATFPGNNSTLRFQGSSDYTFPGDFTIEYRLKFSGVSLTWNGSTPSNQYFLDYGNNNFTIGWSALQGWRAMNVRNPGIGFVEGGPSVLVPTVGPWYDVVVARKNGKLGIFVNNALVQSTIMANVPWGSADVLTIGNYGEGQTYGFMGDMDYLRITKGVSRFDF